MTSIDLKERKVDGVTILTVEHGLKGEMESVLRERIDRLVQEGSLEIVVDLRHVPYVDSRDIGRLIRSHLSVRQAGGRVRLCNLSEKVMDVLRLTRLDTVLDLYQSEAEALAGIRGGKAEGRENAAAGPG
jgi:anti-sigma B factor antagonist